MTLEMIGTQSIHPDYSNLHKILLTENHVYRKPRLLTSFSTHIINVTVGRPLLHCSCAARIYDVNWA